MALSSRSERHSTATDTAMNTLFKSGMKGEWDEVVKIYKASPEVHNVKITRSGDTALHLAVSDCQEDIVETLVDHLTSIEHKEALKVKNERGNTPLHLAATLGNVRMCECIAKVDPELIGVRNNDSETPFFLAALQGKKDAFLCLDTLCGCDKGYLYCRRSNGETILHSAIAGEYFDLAFQIIHRYGNLVNNVNEQGFSPLHLLATKPSSFRSGHQLGRFQKIIYLCIFVDELKSEASYGPSLPKAYQREKNPSYPENYQTCINFFYVLRNTFRVLAATGKNSQKDEKKSDAENPRIQEINSKQPGRESYISGAQGHQLIPPNYSTCFEIIKLISKAMLIILGLGSRDISKIQERKEKHKWSVQIMNELLAKSYSSGYDHEENGRNPQHLPSWKDGETAPYLIPSDGGNVMFDNLEHFPTPVDPTLSAPISSIGNDQNKGGTYKDKNGEAQGKERIHQSRKRETPILIAARNGVVEMVEKILELFPVAIHDMNSEKKNIILLAVENRQPHIYQLLLKRNVLKDSVFRKVDGNGNSALHLAAMLGENRPWLIPGAALQMQWEIKWYQFVKNSMPPHFFVHFNKAGQTPKDIFTNTHSNLVKSGGDWLTNTSESCSVVAALIATVAFATSATVPGGVREDIGTPTLENEPAFSIFAIASLVALCFSVTAVVMFLAILTSRYQERDFGKDLPRKLLVGLTSLFVSIASMLISFCAGHFFVLRDKLQYAAFPVYAVTCLPVTFFAIAQFPLYVDLIWATYKKVPQRSYKAIPL